MAVSVSVVSGKTVSISKALPEDASGKPVRIKAVKGASYVLASDGKGVGPENITVKRVGKNLLVALEGGDPDQPELIIENFYGSEGRLIGVAEDGQYHEYIAVDGDSDSAAAFLAEGVSSPLALGYPVLAGFGDGLTAAAGGMMLPWALAGLGALAGGAIVEHNKGGGGKVVDTTPPKNNGIGSVVDNNGPITGEIVNGGVTDDKRPTLGGSGQEPGDKVTIIDNGKVIGEVIVDKDGSWTFTPGTDLGEGKHELEIVVTDPAGNKSEPSDGFEIIVDTTAPKNNGIGSVIDDQGPVTGEIVNGGVTDDKRPTLGGSGQEPGDTVTIIDNGKVIGEVIVDENGSWTFTPGTDLGEGKHDLQVVVTDPAGNKSEPSDGFEIIVDTTPPKNNGIGSVIDDQGPVTGEIVNGGVTDDKRPTLGGNGQEPGDTVTIIDNGEVIGEVIVDENGSWTFTPGTDLGEGKHDLQVVVTDPAGNKSEPSDGFEIIVDTTAPKNNGIDSVIDDQGPITGEIVNGGVTDDKRPTLGGKGQEPGDTVTIIDNGKVIGEVIVDENGSWTFTPGTDLGEGKHELQVVVTDPAGNKSEPSDGFEIIVDTTPPTNNGIGSVVDDQGSVTGEIGNGGVTDDKRPTLSGSGQEPGDTVTIIDNGKVIGEVIVDENGSWTFTPEKDLDEGKHELEIVVTDPAGNTSDPSDGFEIIVDTTPPTTPSIDNVIDDVGQITGPIPNGGRTDDSQPTLNGKGDAGDTVTIIDNGTVIGEVIVGEDGKWTFTPETALEDGEHVFEVIITDPAGNSSQPSDEFTVIIDAAPLAKPVILSVVDNEGDDRGPLASGDRTDDPRPVISGTGTPNTTIILLDKGIEIGRAPVDAEGNWTFRPTLPLGLGDHTLTAEIADVTGKTKAPSDPFDLSVATPGAPAAPSITGVIDDVGIHTGPIQKGDVTDDTRPTVNGTSEVGTTVSVYIDGTLAGTVEVNGRGEWSFTPSFDLADGPHVITAIATNAVGNASPETGEYPFTVDTTPPAQPKPDDAVLLDDVGQITGEITNGTVTDDSTPTFVGKTEPNATVVVYDNGTKIGEAKADATGNWTFTPTKPLDDGDHSLSYEVIDVAGNTSAKSEPIVFEVDTRNVEISIDGADDNVGVITGPIAMGGVTDDATPTLHGKAVPNGIVKIYEGSVLLGQTVADAKGNWSFTPTAPLSEDAHSLTATVTTEANGESAHSAPFDFIVDLSPPQQPTIDAVTDDVGVIQGALVNGAATDDTTPTLAGKAEAGSTVHIHDGDKLLGSVVADANGKWSFTPTVPLPSGDHVFVVTSVDKAGNISAPSDPFQITIDTTPPAKPIIESVYDDQGGQTGFLSSGDETDDNKPTLSGSAEPNATIIVKDNGTEIGRTKADATGKWSFEPTLPLGKGPHGLTVEAMDAAGNTSDPSDRFDVNVVNDEPPAPPAITAVLDDVGIYTGNLQKNAVTDDARPEIQGTAQPGMTVSVYIDGVLVGTAPVNARGEWSFTPSTDLADGLHEISAKATNSVGNVSPETGKYPIVVDTTPPAKPLPGDALLLDDEGSITGPITSGMTTDDTTPTFVGKAEPNATIVIYDHGDEIGRVSTDAEGNWSFTPAPALGKGDHSFNYEIVDAAGNVSPKSDAIDFKVDNALVTVSIDGATDDAGSVTGPISKGGVTDDTTPTLHGKATANGTVKVYDGGVLLGQTVADAGGNWSFTPTTPLSEASHSLTATVTTEANGESAPSTPFDFRIDVTPPVKPTIDSVTDDVGSIQGALAKGAVTDDATPTLAGKAEAGSTVYIRNESGLLGKVTADASGNWSFTPNPPLNNGSHGFTVTAQDKAGNTSQPSDVFDIVVDTVPPAKPVIESVYDNAGDRTGEVNPGDTTDDTKPVISGSAEAGSTVVIKDGDVELGRVTADAAGRWSFEPTTALGKGAHSLTAEAIDVAGNTSRASDAFDFSVDTNVPSTPRITFLNDDVGSYTGLLLNGGTTDDATPTVLGTGVAGEKIEIWMDGALLGTTVVRATGQWSYTPEASLKDGRHEFTAIAVGPGGATSAVSNTFVTIVDTVAPDAPEIVAVKDNVGDWQGDLENGQTTDDRTPTFIGKAERLTTIIVYDNGEEVGSAAVDADGNWKYTAERLTYGEHSFTFEAFDVAGNVSAESAAWVVYVAAFSRSMGNEAAEDIAPSTHDLLVAAEADLFAAEPGPVDASAPLHATTLELVVESHPQDSWASNMQLPAAAIEWSTTGSVQDIHMLENQLVA